MEPSPCWFSEGASNLSDSNEFFSPESVHVLDVPLVVVDLSVKVGLRSVVRGSSSLVVPVSDISSPSVEGGVHPLLSTLDGVSISVSEGRVSWSSEASSNTSNSSDFLLPESVDVSDLPLVVVDVSVIGSLGSEVGSSGDSSSVVSDSVSP